MRYIRPCRPNNAAPREHGWIRSQQDLAKRASVGLSTVKDFENGSRKPIANNLNALRSALEAGGMRFENDPSGGEPIGIRVETVV